MTGGQNAGRLDRAEALASFAFGAWFGHLVEMERAETDERRDELLRMLYAALGRWPVPVDVSRRARIQALREIRKQRPWGPRA